ncbi:MAG TPA: MmgE/PrpD family protein [Chloroflexota bacterium]|nr:MmgE/PrpD family protein [Chloroflexota bacterium]
MAAILERAQTQHPAQERHTAIARDIATFAEALRLEDVPAAVLQRAKLHVLDAVGIAFASSTFDFAKRSLAALASLGEGVEPVLAHRQRLAVRDAMCLNGILIHGLDYDDTHMAGVTHVTASALPLALGIAAQRHLSGADLLLGYLLAVEVSARLGAVAQGGFHEVGFHPTGVVGAFGCAVAAARLEGLSVDGTVLAQGLAGSMAAGSMEFLETGDWNKRLHPGWAASCGLTAARFAREGFASPESVYEGRFGLFASFLAGRHTYDLALATRGLGDTWELLNVGLKPYPACHFVHAFADAVLHLREHEGLRAEDVASISCLIAQGEVGTVCEPWENKLHPTSDYDAKFSLPFVVAASLVRGRFSLAELRPDALADPDILNLTSRVSYAPDPDSAFPSYYSGEVVVQTRDGRTLRRREQMNRGTNERPLSAAEIERKFLDNMSLAVNRATASRVRDAILSLEQCPNARDLAELMAV